MKKNRTKESNTPRGAFVHHYLNLGRGWARVAQEDKHSTYFDDPPLDYAYPCFVVKNIINTLGLTFIL